MALEASGILCHLVPAVPDKSIHSPLRISQRQKGCLWGKEPQEQLRAYLHLRSFHTLHDPELGTTSFRFRDPWVSCNQFILARRPLLVDLDSAPPNPAFGPVADVKPMLPKSAPFPLDGISIPKVALQHIHRMACASWTTCHAWVWLDKAPRDILPQFTYSYERHSVLAAWFPAKCQYSPLLSMPLLLLQPFIIQMLCYPFFFFLLHL